MTSKMVKIMREYGLRIICLKSSESSTFQNEYIDEAMRPADTEYETKSKSIRTRVPYKPNSKMADKRILNPNNAKIKKCHEFIWPVLWLYGPRPDKSLTNI